MQVSIVVSATDNFLVRLSQQDGLPSLARAGVGKEKIRKHTCSNCAEYDPWTSTRGA